MRCPTTTAEQLSAVNRFLGFQGISQEHQGIEAHHGRVLCLENVQPPLQGVFAAVSWRYLDRFEVDDLAPGLVSIHLDITNSAMSALTKAFVPEHLGHSCDQLRGSSVTQRGNKKVQAFQDPQVQNVLKSSAVRTPKQ